MHFSLNNKIKCTHYCILLHLGQCAQLTVCTVIHFNID